MKAYIGRSDNQARLDVAKIPKSAMREMARCALAAMLEDFTKPASTGKTDEQIAVGQK